MHRDNVYYGFFFFFFGASLACISGEDFLADSVGVQSNSLTTPSWVQEEALSELFHMHFLIARKSLTTLRMYAAALIFSKGVAKLEMGKKCCTSMQVV